MNDLEKIWQMFIERGFLNFKKVSSYIFPLKDLETESLASKPWVRKAAKWGPPLSIISLLLLYLNRPTTFFALWPLVGRFMWFALFGYAVFFTILLLVASLILKRNNQDPSILLAIMLWAPAKVLFVMGVAYLFLTTTGINEQAAQLRATTAQMQENHTRIKEHQKAMSEARGDVVAKWRETAARYKREEEEWKKSRPPLKAPAEDYEKIDAERREKERQAFSKAISDSVKRDHEKFMADREKDWAEWRNRDNKPEPPKKEEPNPPVKSFTIRLKDTEASD